MTIDVLVHRFYSFTMFKAVYSLAGSGIPSILFNQSVRDNFRPFCQGNRAFACHPHRGSHSGKTRGKYYSFFSRIVDSHPGNCAISMTSINVDQYSDRHSWHTMPSLFAIRGWRRLVPCRGGCRRLSTCAEATVLTETRSTSWKRSKCP